MDHLGRTAPAAAAPNGCETMLAITEIPHFRSSKLPRRRDSAPGLPGSMIPIRIGARESIWWDAEVAVMRSRVTAKPLDIKAPIEIKMAPVYNR